MRFLKFYRLIFVLFSLYLVGDALYRWDAFRYYGTFSEFLPAYALMSILWSITALFTALLMWLLLVIFEWISCRMKVGTHMDHLLLFGGLSLLLGGAAFMVKKFIWPSLHTAWQLKVGVFIGVITVSLFLTWRLRNKASSWMGIIHDRITPIVWLFGVITILSVPFVAYHTWWKHTDKIALNEIRESLNTAKSRPNIILLTFDTLTARDMSTYGFDKETTPFISQWARSATVFSRLEAAANYTAPTTATLMTGKRVWNHRRFQSHAGAPVKVDTESVPLLLNRSGYFNMAFVANSIASVQELGMSESFRVAPSSHEFISPARLFGFIGKHLYKAFGAKIKLNDWILYEDFILDMITPDMYIKYPYRSEFPIERVFDNFQEELNGNIEEPYFAWIHVFPPHFPYMAPEEEAGLFDPSMRFRSYGSQFKLVRPRYFSQEQQNDADNLRIRYDEFIRYCDRQFMRFIEELEKRGKLRNTVIILSSDHGESFEHGFLTHGGPYLFEQMTHLPLIIKEPEQIEGKVIDILVDQADISATVLDLAGISVPSWMEGRSLVPVMRGKEIETRPVFSMNLEKNPSMEKITKGTIAVWEDDYKLIYYLEEERSLLFHITRDPGELNNLIDKEPEAGQRLLGLIQGRLKEVNKKFHGEDH